MTIAQAFFEIMLESQALRFGNFTTKSGRISPYFFNSAQFYNGQYMGAVADLYAEVILAQFGERVEGIFGPSYKGITLACMIADRIYQRTGRVLPFFFDRKEAKTHGEGGFLLGREDRPAVVIVEDALTQGTSIRDTMPRLAEWKVLGLVVGLDRCERGFSAELARDEIQAKYDMPVYSLLDTWQLVELLEASGRDASEIKTHLKQFS